MLQQRRKTFSHGIHPPQCKEETAALPIQRFPFAPVMILPLQQHIGKASIPIVREGQEVMRGQCIAKPDGFLSVALHAPVTGVIEKIGLVPHIKGQMVQGIYLRTLDASTQEVMEGEPCDWRTATAPQIINAIQNAGIVGLGGAAFPTHAKLTIPKGKTIDTLIINGAECEPYLTTDHRVMLEQTQDIYTGIRYLLKATGAPRAILGVEANKTDAALRLQSHIPVDLPLTVAVLNTKYPQGADKILIKTLLNRELPPHGHAMDVHVIGVNVATCAEVGRLLPRGQGIQERVITITGPAVAKKGNYRIPIGTPLRFALQHAKVANTVSEVFIGGPMMGQSLSNLDIPITKGTSGFVAYNDQQTAMTPAVLPCIHCGYCVDVCPLMLNPAQLGALARNEQLDIMVNDFHLFDCFECGACAYVCPSHIPLVQWFRLAKSQWKKLKLAEK